MLVRREKFENRRKNHNYTYTYILVISDSCTFRHIHDGYLLRICTSARVRKVRYVVRKGEGIKERPYYEHGAHNPDVPHKAAEIAMAASTAFPPDRRILAPISLA